MYENLHKQLTTSRRRFLQMACAAGTLPLAGGLLGESGVLKALAAPSPSFSRDGEWHYSYCRMCMRGDCAVRYRVQDNVVMEVQGNPASPTNKGALCPRGQ